MLWFVKFQVASRRQSDARFVRQTARTSFAKALRNGHNGLNRTALSVSQFCLAKSSKCSASSSRRTLHAVSRFWKSFSTATAPTYIEQCVDGQG